MEDLKTVPQLAREAGVTTRQADYAIREKEIQPAIRVGIIRLFDETGAHHLKEALEEIGGRREVDRG